MTEHRSMTYTKKSRGGRTDPCGTPILRFTVVDRTPLTFTLCVLSWRWDLNQASAAPRMPATTSRRSSRMVWSVVSKAAERSKRTTRLPTPASRPLLMSWILSSAVSVLCPGLYRLTAWGHGCCELTGERTAERQSPSRSPCPETV